MSGLALNVSSQPYVDYATYTFETATSDTLNQKCVGERPNIGITAADVQSEGSSSAELPPTDTQEAF